MTKGAKASNHEVNTILQAVPPGDFQQVAIGASSAQSAELQARTSMVWLFATKDCWVRIGNNPTAVADTSPSFLLRGGFYRAFAINNETSDPWKIAVIQDVESGELDIMEGGF